MTNPNDAALDAVKESLDQISALMEVTNPVLKVASEMANLDLNDPAQRIQMVVLQGLLQGLFVSGHERLKGYVNQSTIK